MRNVVLVAGASAIETAINQILREEKNAPICAKNHVSRPMHQAGRRSKTVRTILGPIRIERCYWVCPICDATRLPADELLGVVDTGFSPGARRMMARAGSKESFAESAEDLRIFANLKVDAKDVERIAEQTGRAVEEWMAQQGSLAKMMPPCVEESDTFYVSFDGTGVPMRACELQGIRSKKDKDRAKTREVKLGCVFTQTALDEEGRPIRDVASTTYVGAIENSNDFGHRIAAEAFRRGVAGARRVVVLTDGAAYNKTIAREHFPNAIHILDIFHAREHLIDFMRNVCHLPLNSTFSCECQDLLNAGKIPTLVNRMDCHLPRSGPRRAEGKIQIAYFRKNAQNMRYEKFRSQGMFIGSGVIEAGCKTVIAKRLKQSGMFWSVRGANSIIALRCCIESRRFEQFWEDSA